jgi:putative redox protein
MRVRLRAIVDPTRYRVEARSEPQAVVLDLAPPAGEGAGASPTDTLLASLAGCTAMDVASILRKRRQVADRYEIAIEADRREEHPRVFTRISIEHQIWGKVEGEALRRSIELSATQYCPVNAMLAGTVQIEHRYRLSHPDEGEHTAVAASVGPGRG